MGMKMQTTINPCNLYTGCKVDSPRKLHGFTLVELMIAVAIIAILSAIALPAYSNYVIKAARSDGKASLVDAASRQEQFYLDNKTYADTMAKLGLSGTSDAGKYTIALSDATATTYTMTATPVTADLTCGNLILNEKGSKTASTGATNCW